MMSMATEGKSKCLRKDAIIYCAYTGEKHKKKSYKDVPPELPKLQDVNDGLSYPNAERAGCRTFLISPDCGAAVTAVGSGVALAGCRCLPLRCGRVGSHFSM